ncbi:MAG TPA: NHL domain-containing thioredoxin family protein [Acidothermaceae bacterium]|nr:NHL domain-containing thioredoxin family protein [Acidothermaceae bacterium]
MTSIRAPRVRAPELVGAGGWLNTGGRGLSISELRGKIVLLDFWTFCCINCLHVADELRPLEAKYADVLVVIGVHSPKFVHEADHAAVEAAVERYGIGHAVLDDPQLTTWNAYTARAWPTLVVIDPEGYVVAHLSGEGHAHGLDILIGELIAEHSAKGTLHRGNSPYVPPPPPTTQLRFPGKALSLPDGDVLVSDSGHHSLVVLEPDLETVRTRIGSGDRGLADGTPDTAEFSEPQGLCTVPPDVAARVGYDVVVADTVNHVLRGLRLRELSATTIAGTGRQRMTVFVPGTEQATSVDLSSPWDVAWSASLSKVVVAMAGTHQLIAFDPVAQTIELFAGTGHEGLIDGELHAAWFAQPSGLAIDGDRIWVADSETSALRYIEGNQVHTAIGHGLFTFGHKDGAAAEALLQHPLGVTALPDGSITISDTYNGAVRHYDPDLDTVSTLATDLREPSAAFVTEDTLIVVESAAHRLTAIPLGHKYLDIEAREYATTRVPTNVRAGRFAVRIAFTPPTGQHFDDRYGPSTRLVIEASPPELIVSGAGAGTGLEREFVISEQVSSGVLHVTVSAATCDNDVEHAACHLHQQDWGIPVRISPDGVDRVDLMLRGMAERTTP